ncbi:MAG: hypothetical protein CSA68_04060 [Rhodobacterales bacterium]|nr:MAG: hypothetical protein CSA68_04060 [Rhodobacterales bacterium]
MDFLTRFGIEKTRLTLLVIVGTLLMGVMTYFDLPKMENPVITIRNAMVTAQFPGMAPERVEDLIAVPIERALREIPEVEDINTLISTGAMQVSVAVCDSVNKSKLEDIFSDIRNKMTDVSRLLPRGTIGPQVNTNYGDVAIATIAVTGHGFNYAELWDAADDLRQQLYGIDGVSKVSMTGQQDERIWLEIDARKLASVGVQLNQVIHDLQEQNVILPAGELDAGGTNLTLSANGELTDIEFIGNVLTSVQG